MGVCVCFAVLVLYCDLYPTNHLQIFFYMNEIFFYLNSDKTMILKRVTTAHLLTEGKAFTLILCLLKIR